MRPPGSRLRSLAQRFCDPSTLERLIDPLLADLRHEYADAVRRGERWRGRWIRLAGCIAFWKVAAIVLGRASTREWSTADRSAIGRTIRFSGLATTALTLFFMLPPVWKSLWHPGHRVLLFLALVPQAIPVALPMGVVFGVLCGFRGGGVTPRVRQTIVGLTIVSSLAMIVILGWVLPVGNQTFREVTFAAVSGAERVRIARGMNELSLGELWSLDPYQFHFRLALAFAPLALGVLTLNIATARPRASRHVVIGLNSLAICLGYYILLYAARPFAPGRDELAHSYRLAGVVAAWGPNLIVVAMGLLLHLRTRVRSAADPSRRDDGRRSADRSAVPPT